MIERRNGTYAAATYDDLTGSELADWLNLHKIPNQIPTNKLHSTIIYSRTPIPTISHIEMGAEELKNLGWRFIPDKLALFTSSDGDKDVLVLTLKAPELVDMHENCLFSGATHDHDTYQPHVTLSYDIPKDFDWRNIPVPSMYFVPSRIYFEPLNLNWKAE